MNSAPDALHWRGATRSAARPSPRVSSTKRPQHRGAGRRAPLKTRVAEMCRSSRPWCRGGGLIMPIRLEQAGSTVLVRTPQVIVHLRASTWKRAGREKVGRVALMKLPTTAFRCGSRITWPRVGTRAVVEGIGGWQSDAGRSGRHTRGRVSLPWPAAGGPRAARREAAAVAHVGPTRGDVEHGLEQSAALEGSSNSCSYESPPSIVCSAAGVCTP